jgi:uncharacterized phage infection (PIP) family protein YhgE
MIFAIFIYVVQMSKEQSIINKRQMGQIDRDIAINKSLKNFQEELQKTRQYITKELESLDKKLTSYEGKLEQKLEQNKEDTKRQNALFLRITQSNITRLENLTLKIKKIEKFLEDIT